MAQDNQGQRQVEKDLPWNFTVNVLDVSFYMLGLNIVARQTILPLLVSQLTPSKLAIGLIPAVDSIGFLLPQLLAANFTEGLRRKLPFVAAVGIGERLPYLVIGLIVWQWAQPAPSMTVALLLLLLTIHTACGGIITPAWFDLVAKVIPIQRRGFWSGVAHGGGALLGVAGAAVSGKILVDWPYPQNFAMCFFLAFLALMLSWIALVLNREPDSPSVRIGTRLTQYLSRLPAVLRRNPNYVRFLLSRSLAGLGGMATGFYAVYGSERWNLGGEGIAILTAILTGSQAVMGVAWGLVGDRKGHKVVLSAAPAGLALAALAALAAPNPLWLWATFALLGSTMAGYSASGMNMSIEFCADEDRPTYIGLTSTLLAPVSIVAPLLGGALATVAGYAGLFVISALCGALGAMLMAFWVRDPRAKRQNA